MTSSEDEGVSGMTSDVRELRRAKKQLSRQLQKQQRQLRAHQVRYTITTTIRYCAKM